MGYKRGLRILAHNCGKADHLIPYIAAELILANRAFASMVANVAGANTSPNRPITVASSLPKASRTV